VVAGNPARVKKYRFDEETIDLLLKLRWWDKDIEEIKKLIPFISSPELDKEKLKKLVNK
jgi:virginiamycin A acetyltransferase